MKRKVSVLHKRLFLLFFILAGLILTLPSCSSDDLAPDSIGGKEYRISIESGSGEMSSIGSSIIAFDRNGRYKIDGDDVYTASDTGTYTYKKKDARTGMVALTSSEIDGYQESSTFEFVEKRSGKYSARTTTGDAGEQTGTFNEI